MCCTMPKFIMPPPCTSTPRAPLIKFSYDNIYPHCKHTKKIYLLSVNTVHTTHTIIMHVHTACAIIMRVHTAHTSITHVPLNPHHTMLNLVRTPTRQNFPRITILHHASPKLSVHTHALIFFMHYHSTLCNAKIKCTHPHTNILRAMPLSTAQCQILARTPACQHFST
jgi:hypothetical protein